MPKLDIFGGQVRHIRCPKQRHCINKYTLQHNKKVRENNTFKDI